MKIVLAQLNPVVGAVRRNLAQMMQVIEATSGADVVIFSELVVPGYPPKDLLLYPEFVETCLAANTQLEKLSDSQTLLIWGNIDRNTTGIGKPLHNTGFCAVGGKILAKAYKSHLPTYDVFDEARYFEPGTAAQAVPVFEFRGKTLGLSVCEDLWSHPCLPLADRKLITPILYDTAPLNELPEALEMLINLSASPYQHGKPRLRTRLLQEIAQHQGVTLVYVNQVGANDDLIFDGHSAVTLATGQQWVLPGFETARQVLDPDCDTAPTPEPLSPWDGENELIAALVLGISDYVHKTGFEKVFIGLSGGIDSALTAALAQKALGKENVIGVAMPGPYSSTESLEDAQALAEALGIQCRVHSIMDPFQAYLDQLSSGKRVHDLAEENLQSRLRGLILMTLANRENALVLTTGNKSELATGYCTLYGDTCGALAPLGDVYKTWVYRLCEAMNAQSASIVIPQRTLDKPPSAELAPDQKDSDSLPPYPVLDGILQGFLEEQLAIGELLGLGYDENDVFSTLRRVMANEYKRKQMAPSLKVTRKAFGSGRVHPIVQQVELFQKAQLV